MARLQVNPECRIFFEGWETTTVQLGQRGWRMSLEESQDSYEYPDEKRLLLYHPPSNLKMLAICKEFRMYMEHDRYMDANMTYRRDHEQRFNGPDFRVVHIANDLIFRYDTCMPQFAVWGETKPRMMDITEQDIATTPLFMKLKETETKEIIVEPQEVSQLLEQIMRMQSPGQAEIRKRNRLVAPQVHASILTFPGAA